MFWDSEIHNFIRTTMATTSKRLDIKYLRKTSVQSIFLIFFEIFL